ncbi:MAG: hypothetical protein PUP93_16175, partial [Rhizonema sp. NSF051]|nr:hypothetical protein [Rhizonema sp. NSF051]
IFLIIPLTALWFLICINFRVKWYNPTGFTPGAVIKRPPSLYFLIHRVMVASSRPRRSASDREPSYLTTLSASTAFVIFLYYLRSNIL